MNPFVGIFMFNVIMFQIMIDPFGVYPHLL